MSKFNSENTMVTTNHCNHAAYKMSDKTKLVTQVLTSFFNEEKFYGDNSEDMQETIARIARDDPRFISNLAIYARREFNMRSVAHVLTACLAHETAGKPYVRHTLREVTVRGDDLTEIMAYYLRTFGKPIPNSLRKGIGDVLNGFDEYTLAKYKGQGKSVKMRDLLCLCHPTPKDDAQSELWKRCLEGTLEVPETWETQLSANGNNTETWERLIASGKVSYMALLRNLRNIISANPKNLETVLSTIEDPAAVRKSRQLPFRFLSAYKAVKDIAGSRLLGVLENAVEASISNIPQIPGRTVIAVDISGSMGSQVSGRSEVKCAEIAMMLGLIANRICDDSLFYVFSDRIWKVPMSAHTSILHDTLNHATASGGTNMYLPFEVMMRERIDADRIIILSDNECNGGYFHRSTVQSIADIYRKQTGNDIWVHAIDLQGYGTQQFCGTKTNIIAGWSEKVFDFILLAESGSGSLIEAIENYEAAA